MGYIGVFFRSYEVLQNEPDNPYCRRWSGGVAVYVVSEALLTLRLRNISFILLIFISLSTDRVSLPAKTRVGRGKNINFATRYFFL